MRIDNCKMNFFLPNYFAGKNNTSKTVFSITKETYSSERPIGSYNIDPNIYVEEYKQNGKNHFPEMWELSDDYLVEIQMFFDESKYSLEKLLKEHRDSPAKSFSKPLVSKALEQAKKIEVDEDLEYDNQEKYNQKRQQLMNKYAGALVGHGGYRIFNGEQEKMTKKESQLKKTSTQNSSIKSDCKTNSREEPKKLQTSQNKMKKTNQPTPNKQATSAFMESQNPQAQMKNIKFLMIGIVVLILLGSGYFLSKIFLKENTQSNQISKILKEKKTQSQVPKKSKAKPSKKAKISQQL